MNKIIIHFKERKFLDSDKSELSKLKSQIIQKDETISMLNFKNQLIKNENETLRERNNELVSVITQES